MSRASGSIRPSLASLFRWGSVPGSPAEVRAYLQRRVTIYLGFASAFWAAAWLLTTLLGVLTRPEDVIQGVHALRTALHLAMALAMTALWLATRRKERSAPWLVIVDLTTAVLQGCFLGILMLGMLPLIRYRPDLVCLLGLTYVLVSRAAVVPSTAPLSVRLGEPVPASLERAVLACLGKAPADRPKDAAALLELLDACPDLAPWAPEDARRWWSERASLVKKPPTSAAERSAVTGLTLDIARDRHTP